MTSLEAALRQVHTDLIEAHVSCALVGGLSVSARTEPRFTRDADLAVALANDAEAEALIHHPARPRLRHRGDCRTGSGRPPRDGQIDAFRSATRRREGLPEPLTRLSTTGQLGHEHPRTIERWLDAACAAGLVHATADRYRTLSLTERGRDVMTGRVDEVTLAIPVVRSQSGDRRVAVHRRRRRRRRQ